MSIRVNNEVVELMIYFWESVSEREKVSEDYLRSVSQRNEMKLIYNENFNEESVRKVLSAISNRELLNGGTKEEKRFWNNNMWMMEDLSLMKAMIDPIKKLNLDEIKKDLELIFIPGHIDEHYVIGNKLVVNFFKINVDVFGGSGKVTMNGKDFKEYIINLIEEVKED